MLGLGLARQRALCHAVRELAKIDGAGFIGGKR
jgi:hypothetical protein